MIWKARRVKMEGHQSGGDSAKSQSCLGRGMLRGTRDRAQATPSKPTLKYPFTHKSGVDNPTQDRGDLRTQLALKGPPGPHL